MVAKIQNYYRELNRRSRGRLGILQMAFSSFSATRASQAAASMAYYAFFSMFPLLLVMTAISSFFIDRAGFYDYLMQILSVTLPVSQDLISENLDSVIQARGAVGLAGLASLIWSASGMFSDLVNSISLAWPEQERRGYFQVRLFGVVIVVALSSLIILSLFILGFTGIGAESGREIMGGLTFAGSYLAMFVLFVVLYRWVPETEVSWRASLISALLTSIGWRLAIRGFGWYLTSGFGQYQLVYGTLGAIVALLFLLFILSNITLFGAHLSAAIDRWEDERRNPRS